MQSTVIEKQKEILAAQQSGSMEASLVRQAMLGDAPSLENLVARYYDAIHAFCCRRVGDAFAGADACQETFLKMVRYLPQYRERGYFKSWLFAIASNCCNDAFRRKRPTVEIAEDIVDDTRPFDSSVTNATLIKEALDKLPAEQKEVVLLRYYHDFSTKDVARVQRVPASTVKTRLHRALKKLQRVLGKEILLET